MPAWSMASVVRWILVVLLAARGFFSLRDAAETWASIAAFAGAGAAYATLASSLLSVVAAVMLALRQRWVVFALSIQLALVPWLSMQAEFVPVPMIIFDLLVIAFCIREWTKGRLSVAPRSSSSEALAPHRAWWGYFFLLVALFAAGFFFAAPLFLEHWPIALGSTILSVVGLLGLWCYLRSKPLGWRGFWEVSLALEISRDLVEAWLFLNKALSGLAGIEGMVAIILFGCTLLLIPLAVAIWRYVYRSPAIWQTAAPAT